jgi:hypothetical protein
MREIDHPHDLTANLQRQPVDGTVRQPKKLLEQAELADDFEGRRMHGIAAKIAQKICMLFQDDNTDPGTRQEKAKHHSRRSAAGDATLRGQRLVRHDLLSLLNRA